jgi:DNA-binding XRE family transcriptional regulator
MKKKISRELSPLSVAVKRIRQRSGYTQEQFAQAVGLAVMTVSRFETGRQVPTDPNVLMRLEQAARDAGLSDETALFSEALGEFEWSTNWGWTRSPVRDPPTGTRAEFRVSEWRLMQAVRVLCRIRPEAAGDLAQFLNTASGAVDLVDEVLKTADPAQVASGSIWRDLEKKVTVLADHRALERLQGKTK